MEGFTEGPPQHFAPISARQYEKYPGVVHGYLPCLPDQKCPILVEEQRMQDYVSQSIKRCGAVVDNVLWGRREILLKLTEELGELVQAFRKKDRTSQLHEYGDLLFAMFALAEREEISVQEELCQAVVRFEKYCNLIANGDSRQDWPRGYGEEFRQAGALICEGPQDTAALKQLALPQGDQAKPLTDSYNRYCKQGCGQPVHKSNDLQICPDCAAAMRASGALPA